MTKFNINPQKPRKKFMAPIISGPVNNPDKNLENFVVSDDNVEYSTDANSEDLELSNSEDEYIVERIVNHRTDELGATQYLLKWKGYSSDDNTWEDASSLHCNDLLKEYYDKRKKVQQKRLRERQDDAGYSQSIQSQPSAKSRRFPSSSNYSVNNNIRQRHPASRPDLKASQAREKYLARTKLSRHDSDNRGIPSSKPRPASNDNKKVIPHKAKFETVELTADYPPSDFDWEKNIDFVEMIHKKGNDGIWAFVYWKGEQMTYHPLSTVMEKAPQKLIEYFENYIKYVS